MKVLRVRYLAHWLLVAETELRMVGVLTVLQDWLLSLSSITLGRPGLVGDADAVKSKQKHFHAIIQCNLKHCLG